MHHLSRFWSFFIGRRSGRLFWFTSGRTVAIFAPFPAMGILVIVDFVDPQP
jgi:hypothetical protein